VCDQVLYACLETFEELKTDSPISHDNLDSAKKVRASGGSALTRITHSRTHTYIQTPGSAGEGPAV
jgi:hypothetical protein